MKTKSPIFGILVLLFFPVLLFSSPDDAKKPIEEVLYKVISSDGIQAGIKEYGKLRTTHPEDYDFSETQLNALGYRFVRERRLNEAIAIFKLNMDTYPKSANVYDSMGEAYLRNGENKKAIEFYEKAIAVLETADLDDNTRDNGKKNADGKLNYLRNPENYRESTVLRDFQLNSLDLPFGKLNPKAPPETEHWGQLAGEWDCMIDARLPNGNWVQGGNAKWLWKYILDGFAVQDLWCVKWIDLPPNLSHLDRDISGTNVRMYLPAQKKWECVWFVNSTNTTSRFEATSTKEKLVMTGSSQRGLSRITFFDITENSFEWKSEQSQNDGETWTLTTKIHGKRVR